MKQKDASPVGLELSAIEAVYRTDLGRLRRVAQAILHDEVAAQDAVQEAFAAAVRARGTYRGESSPATWLWRIVVNRAISIERDRRWRSEDLDEDAGRHVGSDTPDKTAERVKSALADLPERQRTVVFLHYYANLDYREISEVLEIAVGSVGATLHAARSKLRKALNEQEVA
jgi:RNA polymerase sigma-70 factor, ECF subfamily